LPKLNKPLQAILFDMDGTLLDSMPYHIIAWKQAFAESGYYPDVLDYYLNEGVKHPIAVRDRLRQLGVANPDEQLIKLIYTRKRQIFEEIVEIKPVPGALELLRGIKGKVKLGIVTGGVPEVVRRVIDRLFKGYFDIVVDYGSTDKGKPDPEPYNLGAQLAGCAKENILAVENAPTGIASAVDAGLCCWAVCTTLEPQYLERADRIFATLDDLAMDLLNGGYLGAAGKSGHKNNH
jgi:beta-phosphoglucomutase